MTLLDMVGPVMIGPSSSHTAGACRIGLAAHYLVGGIPDYANIGLHASFAKTGRGHGTHFALIAGLLGYAPDDARLPKSFEIAKEKGMMFDFHDVELIDVHPNTAKLKLIKGAEKQIIGSSTGGGIIEITNIDGFNVKLSTAYPTLIMQYTDTQGILAKITNILANENINIATLQCTRKKRGGKALVTIELDSNLNQDILEYFKNYNEMDSVILLPKLMDG